MVTGVEPSYYAGLEQIDICDIYGSGFDEVPADALGILATDNDDPMHYRNTSTITYLFDILQKSNTHIRFKLREAHTFPTPKFLGGIVSADRSEEYWVNDTAPIP